jgi:uncharacterized membrane protein
VAGQDIFSYSTTGAMKHPDTALDHHDRTEFQLERLILFTDAVFAIAITLLIIEIKVPELHEVHSEGEVLHSLLQLIPKLMGFFVAFFVIAIYWVAHHRIFRFVYQYDNKLIWLNIFFLLSIVLMPFTSAFQGEYPMLQTPWILYCISVIFTGLMQFRLQAYIRNPANGITHAHHAQHPDLESVRPLMTAAVFLFSIGLMLLGFTWVSRTVLGLIFPLMVLYGRRHRRLLAAHNAKISHKKAAH